MSLATRLIGSNPGVQVSSATSGKLLTAGAKERSFEGAMYPIAATKVITATTFVDFAVPSGYTHLYLTGLILGSATSDDFIIQFNGDVGSNYAWHNVNTNGSSMAAQQGTSTAGMYLDANSGNTTYPSLIEYMIHDYASTTINKSIQGFGGHERNSTDGGLYYTTGHWRSLLPVTSFRIYAASGNINANSEFELFGVK